MGAVSMIIAGSSDSRVDKIFVSDNSAKEVRVPGVDTGVDDAKSHECSVEAEKLCA
jgi:hypothetical protein